MRKKWKKIIQLNMGKKKRSTVEICTMAKFTILTNGVETVLLWGVCTARYKEI